MLLDDIRHVLDSAGVEYVLIGGLAVGARGHLRFTHDVDLFTTERRVLDDAMWEPLRAQSKIAIFRGDVFDSLAGTVRFDSQPQIDLVVGKYKWQLRMMERADELVLDVGRFRVPRTSDLILMKLAAGSWQDVGDAVSLLRFGPRETLIAEVEAELEDLPEDAKKTWRKIRD